MARGKKTGGRTAGTPNSKGNIERVLDELGCKPLELAAFFAMDDVPCVRCNDLGQVDPVVGYYLSRIRSSKALDAAVDLKKSGGMAMCPECAGTKVKILADGEQLRAIFRLLDSQLPKLSSIIYTDNSKKTMLTRMNAVPRMRQEQLEREMAEAEAREQAERDK